MNKKGYIRHRGFVPQKRSGLEKTITNQIAARGLEVYFETDELKYTVPSTVHKYTPDFKLFRSDGSFFFIETKGYLRPEDRKKHLQVRLSNPEIEIRFLFQNSTKPIRKGSPTTYGKWAEKNGFQYADKSIPEDWFNE